MSSSIKRKYLNIQQLAASVKQVIQENIGENIIMLNNKIYVGKLQYIKFELLQYYNI